MISKISLKINNKDIELSIDEAKELYDELKKLFGNDYFYYYKDPTISDTKPIFQDPSVTCRNI